MLLYKDILKDDDPILREKSTDVSLPLSQEDIDKLELMNTYLVNGYDDAIVEEYGLRPGVGLAAPQIGYLKRMFVILSYDEEGTLHHYGVINPKIISHSEEMTFLKSGEGCLSVDRNETGYVVRPKRIKVTTHLYDFETKTVEQVTLHLKNYLAIVFQHEYDHLSGILFYDRFHKQNPFFIPENAKPLIFEEEDNEKV